jgi:hypothetical protein
MAAGYLLYLRFVLFYIGLSWFCLGCGGISGILAYCAIFGVTGVFGVLARYLAHGCLGWQHSWQRSYLSYLVPDSWLFSLSWRHLGLSSAILVSWFNLV